MLKLVDGVYEVHGHFQAQGQAVSSVLKGFGVDVAATFAAARG